MNPPIFYTILLAGLIIVISIIYQNRKSKSVNDIKRPSIHDELITLNRMQPIISKNNWSVIVKSIDSIKLDYEENELSNVGYHIYSRYHEQLMQGQMSVYIKDNIKNKYLKIVTDGSSESMIGVVDPVKGFIGYLSFIELEKN